MERRKKRTVNQESAQQKGCLWPLAIVAAALVLWKELGKDKKHKSQPETNLGSNENYINLNKLKDVKKEV